MSKQSKKQRSSSNRHAEQVLFGADSAAEGVSSMLSQQMQATVSLSTLLLLVVAAFAARQFYRCWASNDGYVKLQQTARHNLRANYQSV